jgi:DNA-binding NarL/FixJ family response regulator
MLGKAPRRPRVLLADDHTVVLEGLRRVLEPECEIVGTATDGRALLAAAEQVKPDVVVTDISMPLLNGIDAVRQLKKSARDVRVVFLTMHADVSYAAKALEAGGSGFVLKTSAAEELLTAIREAMNGRKYVTPALSSQVLEVLGKRGSRSEESAETLTVRQREVLQLVAEGKAVKEIAGILHLSSRTVEFHKYRIMEELGLHSTGELTQYAIRHGIVGT